MKWRNQIEKGNWTPEKITRTIRYGERFKARNERTGGSATRYELEGNYVVRDDATGNILQVSRPGHMPKLF
ncbi:MAG: colicin E5-related ribonuclease [Rickettsiales bacterium]